MVDKKKLPLCVCNAVMFLHEDPHLKSHAHEITGHVEKLHKMEDGEVKEDALKSMKEVAECGKLFVKARHVGDSKLDAFIHFIGKCAEMAIAGSEDLVRFVSSMLGILSSAGRTPGGSLLVETMEEILKQYQEESQKEEIEECLSLYKSAHHTLIGMEKVRDLKEEKWHGILEKEVPNNLGAEFLGRMSEFLRHPANEAKDGEEAKGALKFVDAYCKAVFCRADLLFQKYRLLSKMGIEDMAYILENIKGMFSREEGEKLEFLYRPLVPRGALVAAHFKHFRSTAILAFLNITGIKPPNFIPANPQYPMVQMYQDAYYCIGADMSKIQVPTTFTRIGELNQFKMEAHGKKKEVHMIVTAGDKPLCLLACPEDPSIFLKLDKHTDQFINLPAEITTDYFFRLELLDDQDKKFCTSEMNAQSQNMFGGCTLM